jgi:uncharacterized protein YecE (DUF72 family)
MYPSWRGRFYPKGLPQRAWLAYLGDRVDGLELNGTFYSLKRPGDYRTWAEQVPAEFEFAVKGGRYITHLKQLNDVETALANFFASGVLALGERLGPVLWQLPSRTRLSFDRLAAFLDLLPQSTSTAAGLAQMHDAKVVDPLTITEVDRPIRHALEVRNETFRTPEVLDLLRRHGVALVMSHSAGEFPYFEELTSDLVYVRLHGRDSLYVGSYSDDDLSAWVTKIREWSGDHDVRVYFDNDTDAVAPHDAMRLLSALRRGGWPAPGSRSRQPRGEVRPA